ncbi:MAG TPA: (Fe-S)-binding protein [candidate division Zixibacteria bacterium]|nr:(Fe-S)-binding protein [candidate division Zixibacteria bacterium]
MRRWLYAKDTGARGAGCVLCGSCYGHGPANPFEDVPGPASKCPPYEFYRFQRFTPKSRWLMAQRVFHGLDAVTPELKEVVYTCTNCLMCQELCGVRNDGYGPWDITVAMREEIAEKEGPIAAHRPIFEGLRQHDNPWALPRSERGRWAAGLGLRTFAEAGKASTWLFAGCSADREEGRASAVALARLMQRCGEDFAIMGPEERCCGLYAFDLGFRAEFERLRKANLEQLAASGARRVVVACGSCLRMWREYAREKDPGVEILHGTEYVERQAREGRLRFTKRNPRRVTYHDSCHLGRGCGVYGAPRDLLRMLPGVELREMERNGRWSWCCGGGGGVPEAYPELAQWNAADRMREAEAAGAELVLTTSALCRRSFAALERALPSQDLLELVLQAL